MNGIVFAFFQFGPEVATDLGNDRGKVLDGACRNNAAAIFCNKDQIYGALRPIMSSDVIITYRYRVKDSASVKQLRRICGAA